MVEHIIYLLSISSEFRKVWRCLEKLKIFITWEIKAINFSLYCFGYSVDFGYMVILLFFLLYIAVLYWYLLYIAYSILVSLLLQMIVNF